MREKSLFLRACRGEQTCPVPVWLMRQAGRVLPPYRDLRRRYESIQTLFTTPELAAEITAMPIEWLGVDAAILFTDLVTPLGPLGHSLTYAPGPVLSNPLRNRRDLDGLRDVDPEVDLAYVMETVRQSRQRLPPHIPLIGYAGSPFTLATWLVEGRSSRDFAAFRAMLRDDPVLAHDLLDKLSDLVIAFLRAQVRHGVHAVQLFDTSVGLLSASLFAEFVLPRLRRIYQALADLGAPRIYFPLGAAHCLPHFPQVGADVLSADWRLELSQWRAALGPRMVLQGNLDPAVLYARPEVIECQARQVLRQAAGHAHIFNLGHGLQPDMEYERVKFLVETVHRLSEENEP